MIKPIALEVEQKKNVWMNDNERKNEDKVWMVEWKNIEEKKNASYQLGFRPGGFG